MFKSTTDVLRAIHASPRERALFTGPVLEPSEAMQDVVNLFMRLREIMKQRCGARAPLAAWGLREAAAMRHS